MARRQVIHSHRGCFFVYVDHPIEFIDGSALDTTDGCHRMAVCGGLGGECITWMFFSGFFQDVVSISAICYCHALGGWRSFSFGVFVSVDEPQLNADGYILLFSFICSFKTHYVFDIVG